MLFMLSVKGDAVLKGEVEASCSEGAPVEGTVYLCDQLTVPEVRRALAIGVVGIISNKGDFACHAANLLRSSRSRGQAVVWIRGLKVSNAAWVRISNAGLCEFNDGAVAQSTHGETETDVFDYTAGATEWDRVCFWPDRHYSDDEFELVRRGMEACASELVSSAVVVTLWRGRIWFSSPALTSEGMLRFSSNPDFSIGYLERMAGEYEGIVSRIIQGDYDRNLPTIFFSTLLPFHKSNGTTVIRAILADLGEDASRIADIALTNGVVAWLDRTRQFTSSTKVAGDVEWNGLLPPRTIASYVSETERNLNEASRVLSPDVARWLALLVVVKEFKMVISKNLYARYLRRQVRS